MSLEGLRRVVAADFRKLLRQNNKRILGLDVGNYRVGIALAENIQEHAVPLKVLKRKNWTTKTVSDFVNRFSFEHNVGGIVVGWPIDLQCKEGAACQRVARFMRQVGHEVTIQLPYTFQDEFMSTIDAYEDILDTYGPM